MESQNHRRTTHIMMLPNPPGPPPRPALDSEQGAFDLPSIITGVVVVGVLTAGVLASIFGVIPFAQDNGAKQDNAAIRTAEGVAKAKDGRFMDSAGLVAAGYLPAATVSAAGAVDDGSGFARVASAGQLNYAVATDALGTCYVSVAKSGSGRIYYATDAKSEPAELTPSSAPGCVPAPTLDALVTSVGGFAPKYIASAPAGPNFASPISWKQQTAAPAGAWVDVAASSDAAKILASQPGGLYRSADAGATWTKLLTPAGLKWKSVASSADGTRLMAITDESSVYISADSGATWAKKLTTAAANGFVTAGSSADGKNLITAAYNALVWVSNDYGNTWTSKNLGASIMWQNTEVSPDGTTMVAATAYSAKLQVSRDGGATWGVPYENIAGIGSTALSSDGKVVLAVIGGRVRVSTDYGVTFALQSGDIAADNSFAKLSVSDDGTKMIASSGTGPGGIYTSTDTGKTWTLNTAPGATLASVFTSADGAKVVAANGTSMFTGAYPE
jgi:photosystem II stability/assembly factor-like uncharacterized protein